MDLGRIGPVLVVVGLVVVGLGGLLWLLGGLGLGRLPGDISWRRGDVHVFVPIASCIVISVVLTLVLNLLVRR